MLSKRTTKVILLAAVLALILAACGDGSDDGASAATDEQSDVGSTSDMNEEDAEEFSFGSPAEASDADRSVEIDAKDNLSFEPAEVAVSAGETITFVVTNTGAIPHDFTLGDEATQNAHEEEMSEMADDGEMMEHADPNTMELEPGETKELTWTFSETGTVLIGCHQPGHYDGGMKGSVVVEG